MAVYKYIKRLAQPRLHSSKGQNWGIDILIGAGIFVLGLILFFYIVEKKSNKDNIADLLSELEKMSNSMVASEININNPCAFIVGNKVDKLRLQQCANDYNYSKILFGIKNDYCIYFVDKQGNLLNISSLTNNPGIGIGSSDINYTILDDSGNPTQVLPCS